MASKFCNTIIEIMVIPMQINSILIKDLLKPGLYEVSFISQTLEDLLAEEILEDNDYDSDGDNTELSDEIY
ncbi:hypothetical protein C2G38_2203285 [Gigaspora rosea]|uniref:Uncharacterized protein n=1 Tax=Gigaspora rosea TaxID=44941 RepID=A0A397UQ91_9GLOM|nr:hypothetical protein C2G38_2203285 [Gigaspora rosea]